MISGMVVSVAAQHIEADPAVKFFERMLRIGEAAPDDGDSTICSAIPPAPGRPSAIDYRG